jgi:hypothetical protein
MPRLKVDGKRVIEYRHTTGTFERAQLETLVTSYSIGNVLSGIADILRSPLGIGLSLLAVIRYFFPTWFQDGGGVDVDPGDFSDRLGLQEYLEATNLASIAAVGYAAWRLTPAGRWASIGIVGGTILAETVVEPAIAALQAARNQSIALWTLEEQRRAANYATGGTGPYTSPGDVYRE